MSFLWLTPLSSYTVDRKSSGRRQLDRLYFICILLSSSCIYIVRFNHTWHWTDHNELRAQSTPEIFLQSESCSLNLNQRAIHIRTNWSYFILHKAHPFDWIWGNCFAASRVMFTDTVVNDWCDEVISRHSQKGKRLNQPTAHFQTRGNSITNWR